MRSLITSSGASHLDGVLGLFYPSLGLVRYEFDWRKYGKIDGPINDNYKLIEEYGTIHHEIYHYLQTISTTYCYYLFLLEHSKACAYRDLVSFFNRSKATSTFRLPFWACLNLPAIEASLSDQGKVFRDTRFQHANSAHILQELIHKGERIPEVSPSLLRTVVEFSCDAIRTSSNIQESPFPKYSSLFSYIITIPDEHLWPVDDTGVQITGEMILENAAFFISTYPFWHEDSNNSTSIVLEKIQHFGNAFYARLIELAARALQINSAPVFKNTFLTICDLALNIPLKSNRSDANDSVHWMDLHPGWRFVRILSVARRLSPIKTYEHDYIKFASSVCEELKWETPIVLTEMLVQEGVHVNRKNRVWLDAELERSARDKKACPWRFFDPGDDLFLASDWIVHNFPPMVEDTVNHNVIITRKNQLGYQTLDWYFETKLPHCLMLDTSLKFFVPALSDDTISTLVSKKLSALKLALDSLKVMPQNLIDEGFANYAKRRKYYSLTLNHLQSDVFFCR